MPNEFRKDVVSGDWTLVAPSRAKRPDAPESRHEWEDSHQSIDECPFEHLSEGFVFVMPNKYPALQPGVCGEPVQRGPFLIQSANGFHDLVITRDHERHMADFTDQETTQVLGAYQDRYRVISKDECGDYISIFHNYRREAGASVWHNHSQILSTPIVPPEVRRSLHGAHRYFQEHQHTVHCAVIAWELEQQKRIIFENDRFVVFCPFVSKTPYEMRVFPKEHASRFEATTLDDLKLCAQALNAALHGLHKGLGDPPFNFYIHTAPVQKDPDANYDYYHWHIEIVPKIKIDAGFELGTGLYMNPVDPDAAAEKIRKAL